MAEKALSEMSPGEILELEIKTLEQIFTKNHERFQILTASVDELSCRFIGHAGKQYDIQASITITYPARPPVWFTDCEESSITDAIEILGNTSGLDNHIMNQVNILLRELCRLYTVPFPPGLDNLEMYLAAFQGNRERNPALIDFASDYENDSESEEEKNPLRKINAELERLELDETEEKPLAMFKRLRETQQQDRLEGSVSGSFQATERLMKELQDIYRSDSFKSNMYSVELVNESIYEWNVRLMSVDPNSPLHDDLVQLKEKEGEGSDIILLNFIFKETYPSEPPLVIVRRPFISCVYVDEECEICTEGFKECWSSAYTVEGVIMQIADALVEGGARIVFE